MGRAVDARAARSVQSTALETISAAGPQKWNNGNCAELGVELVAQARRVGVDVGELATVGRIHRTRRHRPVRARIHVVPPEQVGAGERRIASARGSPTPSRPRTRRFDCRHNQTSERSRKYQPLATMPWSRGSVPVNSVDCTVVVTAGVTVSIVRNPPRDASRAKLGACGPIRAGVRPATSSTSVACMSR